MARGLQRYDVVGALHGVRALFRGRGEQFVVQTNLVLHCVENFLETSGATIRY